MHRALAVEADTGLDPRHLVAEAEFLDELDDGRVAAEEVVVAAFETASADVEGRRLTAEERGPFVHDGLVAAAREFVCGR